MRPAISHHRGSILIAVVGLLALMAVIAVAFLNTSRTDRLAVLQDGANTQADLLLDGVLNVVKAEIAHADLTANDYAWLASRTPTTLDPNATYAGNASNDNGTNLAIWPAISGPLAGQTSFESPVALTGSAATVFTSHQRTFPTFVQAGGKSWPALRVNVAPPGQPANYQTVIAGDADGDGVADAGLFRLPVGQFNGLTYFAAVRVIDNNAAINLNTALSRDYDFNGDGSGVPLAADPNAGAFTAHIGLAELLRTTIAASAPGELPPPPSQPAFDAMSQAAGGEFESLNRVRWNILTSPLRPEGVEGSAVYDDTPLVNGYVGPRVEASGSHAEFRFASFGDFLQTQVGRRVSRLGVTQAANGIRVARSTMPDAIDLVTRFSLTSSAVADNRTTVAIERSINFGPSTTFPGVRLPTQPYNGASDSAGINTWFRTHFDTLAENPADPATWMCRRTILTGANGVSVASPSAVAVPTVPMAFAAGGVKASIITARFEELFSAYFKVFARPGYTGKGDGSGTPFSPLFVDATSARSGVAFNTAAGIFTGNVGSLGGGYYDDPYIGTRFISPTPASPLAAASRPEPAGLASVINGKISTTSQPIAEQHPLRMFRSPLRPPPVVAGSSPPTSPVWNRATPRLPADQVTLLRAAIAAANLEAVRDSSHCPTAVDPAASRNERIGVHQVPLTAFIDNVATPVVANVYGLRRQPFITEVYANTLAGVDGAVAPGPPAIVNPNPKGYVAIKIYNPTAAPISLQYCRLVGLRRSRSTPYGESATPGEYPQMVVKPLTKLSSTNTAATDQIEIGTAIQSNVLGPIYQAYVVPPHGTLVLENLPGSSVPLAATAAEDATYRPTSSGMLPQAGDNTGLISPADFQTQNFAYVPGLSRVVWDRDLVLMRPPNCQPPSPGNALANTIVYTQANPSAPTPPGIAGMVPLDSYDFTGLAPRNDAAYSPVRTRAEIWHYVRTVAASKATSGHWRWAYPGRYDANQSILSASGQSPAPRQQGTVRAVGADGQFGWDPLTTGGKDPLAESPTPGVVVSLGKPIASGTTATYPDQFTIRLLAADRSSDQPLHDFTGGVPNRFPFGGFRRLGDLLEVPFIGAYTIQTEADAANNVDRFVEITPVTMDAVFAEDTDPADNERTTDDGRQSREQIGRFVPLRPSVGYGSVPLQNGLPAIDTFKTNAIPSEPPTCLQANDPQFYAAKSATADPQRYSDAADETDLRLQRYAFASTLFDYFVVASPNDDYVPNYPTQPQWRPGTAYAAGDVVQYGQHVFVCLAEHVSGDSEAASKGAPDWFDAGVAAQPPAVSYATAPTATTNWLPLPRYPLSNSGGRPGSRSDLRGEGTGNPRPSDFFTENDSNEVGELISGQINLNTASEKVLAMLPWVPRKSAFSQGDCLTFSFDVYPPIVTAGGDGIDDNTQIAHAIVLCRDGRYAAMTTAGPNALGIGVSSQTWAASDAPFRSLWDLYRVPGVRAAQNVLLTQATASGTRFDFSDQTLLVNRVSNLVTTRSDSFTLYVLLQGWRDAGTSRAQLAVQRRAVVMIDRVPTADGANAVVRWRVPKD